MIAQHPRLAFVDSYSDANEVLRVITEGVGLAEVIKNVVSAAGEPTTVVKFAQRLYHIRQGATRAYAL